MRYRIPLLLVAASFAASCDGTDRRNLTQPTLFGSDSSPVSVSATSPVAAARSVNSPSCPSVAPFSVPLVIVVQPNDGVDVVVTAIQMQFFDIAGTAMPRVTLPAPVPTTQFGTAFANARAPQTFEATMGIGCGTGHVGSIRIVVETRDREGRRGSAGATVSVH